MNANICKRLCAAAVLILVAMPAMAWAPYFSGGASLGVKMGGDSVRSGGFSGAAGVRYRVSDMNMRTEFEYSNVIVRKEYKFQTANGPTTYDYDMKTQMYLVNVYADPQLPLMHSGLHVGLTAGALTYRRDLPDFAGGADAARTTFVYGASAGFGLRLVMGLHLDAGVRYLRTADRDVVAGFSPYAGLRYGF